MNKKYYFIADYTTKYGVVKNGESLTGRRINKEGNPIVLFEFYETKEKNKESGELGKGQFTIKEADLGKIATDVEPTTNTDNTKEKSTNANSTETTTTKGWKSWSNTKKGLIVGGVVLGVAGIVVAFIYFKKKS